MWHDRVKPCMATQQLQEALVGIARISRVTGSTIAARHACSKIE